jgi:hypothetical protein
MSTPRRILVIANETCAGAAVCDEVRYRAGHGPAEVLVVAPALAGSRMGHWLSSNIEGAREAATERLDASIAALRAIGLEASGQLGDADPMQALDDAFRVFGPDEILISTHPPARSNWLERQVVQKARDQYQVPVTHVVVDLAHEAALTHADPRPGPRIAAETVTLYRTVDYDEAIAVQRSGFTNVRDAVDGRSGVIFSESSAPSDGLEDATVFVVEIPSSALAPYEISTADNERRWVLPAELVNRHAPRALVADWSE